MNNFDNKKCMVNMANAIMSDDMQNQVDETESRHFETFIRGEILTSNNEWKRCAITPLLQQWEISKIDNPNAWGCET